MSYRKITVNGKRFEYVIGKSHTKIKDVGVFENERIGERITIPQYCNCCSTPFTEMYSDYKDPVKLAITPKHIAQVIQANV